jgi:glycosyltransferase involved in cell wall biosynthesis
VADVYVSLSDHEGFGVPLLEAMAHDLPVVTYSTGAVAETVGSAAILLDEKRPVTVAAAAHRACTDGALRTALVAAGRRQVASFGLAPSAERLRQVVTAIVENARAAETADA